MKHNMPSELKWRSLEDRRIGTQLMFYKTVHDYVAIQLQTYFDKPLKYTHHMHPLSFRQIHTAASFNPASVVLFNRLPSEVVLLEDLDSFTKEVCKINHLKFNTLLLTSFIYTSSVLTLCISFHQVSLLHFLPPTIIISFNPCTDNATARNTQMRVLLNGLIDSLLYMVHSIPLTNFHVTELHDP